MSEARVPDRALWVNGRIVRGEHATVSLFDRGARDGEGLFETVRVAGRRPHLWERHMERLVVSAAELGFPVPPAPARLREALDALLGAERLDEAVARITVTRGVPGGRPTRAGTWIEAEPLAARLWPGTVRAAARLVLSRLPFEPGSLARHKTTSRLPYHLAREEARAARADETVLIDRAGLVLEGAVSNVFAVIRGVVVTPPVTAGILPGIARAWVIATCAREGIPLQESTLERGALLAADEVFVTNAVQGVVPVGAIVDHSPPSRTIGLTLRAGWDAAVAAGG